MKAGLRILGVLWAAILGAVFLAGMLGPARDVTGEAGPDESRQGNAPKLTPSAALRLENPVASAAAFSHAVGRLEESAEFRELFEAWLTDRDDLGSHDALFLLADAWAAKAPREAVTWLNAREFHDSRNPYLFSALSQWASRDPQSARDWLDEHHPEAGSTRDYLLAGLIRGAAASDPELALAMLIDAPPSPERLGAVDFLVREELDGGMESAVDLIEQVPVEDKRLRERAIRQLVERVDADELLDLMTWTDDLSEQGERQIAIAAIAARWSRSEPAAAAAWADTIDDPASRSIAYGEIATRWARTSLLEAGEWLEPHEGEAEFDLAARAVAWSTVGIDPDTAFTQVAGISHGGLREESFEQIARLWMGQQPLRAHAYLEGESPIPASIRERLLESYE